MKGTFYCGMNIGEPMWRYSGDWVYEPGECGTSGGIEINEEEWNEGLFSINCPDCGAMLIQDCDHFSIDPPDSKDENMTNKEIDCQCVASDAWRCDRKRHDEVACGCPCHKHEAFKEGDMTNEEIDREVATSVMGWKLCTGHEHASHPWYHTEKGEVIYCDQWIPTTSIEQAFMVVEKLDDCLHLKQHGSEGMWVACFCGYGPKEYHGETASLAICKAVLKAVGKGGD